MVQMASITITSREFPQKELLLKVNAILQNERRELKDVQMNTLRSDALGMSSLWTVIIWWEK